MKTRILLWGAGGHAAFVADIFLTSSPDIEIFAISDEGKLPGGPTKPWTFLGDIGDAVRFFGGEKPPVCVAIGRNESRCKAAEKAARMGFSLVNAIHPSASISAGAHLGRGVVIGPMAVVGTETRLANCCIVNSGAVVEHGSVLDEGVHIAPSATVLGNVHVGRCSWVGAGACVLQSLEIGRQSLVGAGSLVTKNVFDSDRKSVV